MIYVYGSIVNKAISWHYGILQLMYKSVILCNLGICFGLSWKIVDIIDYSLLWFICMLGLHVYFFKCFIIIYLYSFLLLFIYIHFLLLFIFIIIYFSYCIFIFIFIIFFFIIIYFLLFIIIILCYCFFYYFSVYCCRQLVTSFFRCFHTSEHLVFLFSDYMGRF